MKRTAIASIAVIAVIATGVYALGSSKPAFPPQGAAQHWDAGSIKSVGPDAIVIASAAGERRYAVSGSTKVFRLQRRTIASVTANERAVVSLGAEPAQARSIVLSDALAPAPSGLDPKSYFMGRVISASADTVTLWDESANQQRTFLVSTSTAMTSNEASSVSELRPQEAVQVIWYEYSGSPLAGAIYTSGN